MKKIIQNIKYKRLKPEEKYVIEILSKINTKPNKVGGYEEFIYDNKVYVERNIQRGYIAVDWLCFFDYLHDKGLDNDSIRKILFKYLNMYLNLNLKHWSEVQYMRRPI